MAGSSRLGRTFPTTLPIGETRNLNTTGAFSKE